MTLLEASLLGLVQGLTEFLPISSSAHLVFVQHLFGFREPLLRIDLILHAGTLVSLLVYFWKDVAHLVRDSIYGFFSLLQRKPVKHIYEVAPHCRWAWGIILATLPTGVIGIVFKDWFESLFGSLHTVGYELLANSLLLWLTRYSEKGEKGIEQGRWFDFLIIGTLQAVSIVPGISRSGATIAGALFLGFNRETAFRFSFLLAIPAILGASLLELRDGLGGPDSWGANGIGFAVAALSGMVAIFVLAKIVRHGKLHNFAFYTLPFGLLILYTSRFLD